MATLLLGIGAKALSTSLGLAAGAAAGNFGAILGQAAIGALANFAGQYIDNFLFGTGFDRHEEGPRLQEFRYLSSEEGASVPEVYGNCRVGGQVIWSSRFKEVLTEETQSTGGKGGNQGTVTTTTYSYFVSMAVGICSGEVSYIRRIWADGKPLDQSQPFLTKYLGEASQGQSSVIQAIQGSDIPAYKDIAYIVVEEMPLARFGNRIPNMIFEVVRKLPSWKDGQCTEDKVQAVTIIPGSTEMGYLPSVAYDISANGSPDGNSGGAINYFPTGSREGNPINSFNELGKSDWEESMDELQRVCPNVKSTLLVVAWFGSDLRAGECTLKPKREYLGSVGTQDILDANGQVIGSKQTGYKVTNPSWTVGPVNRFNAELISQFEGKPAFGSSPSDYSVQQCIIDMDSRGLEVVFYPFTMMDIEQGNTLPNPWGGVGQPAYPWRGRITCHPAPGQGGTVDKTAAAKAQVDDFFGSAQPSDFSKDFPDGPVTYTGDANDWGMRRFILHYAYLCQDLGVKRFIIGTEMRELTTIRDGQDSYPAVDHYIQLAAECKAILGPDVEIGYAADWSEYFGHDSQDGTGDFHFHLDPLWADPNIDFIGIDNYQPLSDWRAGRDHTDAQLGFNTVYDENYLKSQIEGGELYDYFYLSTADRNAQIRTPITDGGYGKPWVFRAKDLRNWWTNQHFNRNGGVEDATPTSWVPESKPFIFTEAGCAAVNNATNQPNVFIDVKSSESFLPYFSNGTRDDFIQRQYLRVVNDYWKPSEGNNPISGVYGDHMLMWDRTHMWTWDARPYPAFPKRLDIWSDGTNHSRNHWITGRMGFVDLPDLVLAICIRGGAEASRIDVSELTGTVQGYLIDRRMSARAALGQLMSLYRFTAVESGDGGGIIKFTPRDKAPVMTILESDLVRPIGDDGPIQDLYNLQRTQETDLPASLSLSYIDITADYRQSTSEAMVTTTTSDRQETVNFAIGLNSGQAQGIVDSMLAEIWTGREQVQFALPPKYWALEAGDIVQFPIEGELIPFRLNKVERDYAINCWGTRTDNDVFTQFDADDRPPPITSTTVFGAIDSVFLELPLLTGSENPSSPHIASYADPWAGQAVHTSDTTSNYELDTTLSGRTPHGLTTTTFLYAEPEYMDNSQHLDVTLNFGALQSVTMTDLLNSRNGLAIETEPDVWEIVQYQTATLLSGTTWRLENFLRGRLGTEHAMKPTVAIGARVVILQTTLGQMSFNDGDIDATKHIKHGPLKYDIGHGAYQDVAWQVKGVGHKPYSPAHLKVELDGTDFEVTWVRRTRYGGGWKNLTDVPLNEVAEAYKVGLYKGATLMREEQTSSPSFTYTNAMQVADGFNSATESLTVIVQQLSGVVGPGYPSTKIWSP